MICNLTYGSMKSWSQMCRMLGEKIFSTLEKITLIDLRMKDLIEYIKRFKKKMMLDIQGMKVCIQRMFGEYRLQLQNLPIPIFTTSVEAKRRTNKIVLKQKRTTRFGRKNIPIVNAIEKRNKEKRGPSQPNLCTK